jgi:lysophospholipase L1-like esterase
MPYELTQLAGLAAVQAAAGTAMPFGCANFNPANTRKIKRAKARIRAGVSNGYCAFIGDSTTRGAGSATPLDPFKAFPARFAERMTAEGVPARNHSIFGNGATAVALPTVDSRNNWASGWNPDGNQSVGSRMFVSPSPNTSTWSFQPTETVDTFEVYYITQPGQGTFTLNVNGGATLATVDSSQANSIGRQVVTTTLGTNTLNIARTTGGTVRIVGLVAYNSAFKQLNVMNWGWSGSTTGSWDDAASVWLPAAVTAQWNGTALPSMDFYVICLSVNDANAGTALATYRSELATLVDAGLTAGADVILMSGPPADPASFASLATQRAYVSEMFSLALEKNLPFIDLHAIIESYAVGNALGYYYDTLHPNDLFNHVWGGVLADVMRGV